MRIIELLQEALAGEFQQWSMYYLYKGLLGGDAKDTLKEHFEEHADDEAGHIDVLIRHLRNLGAMPATDHPKIPDLNDLSWESIVRLQLEFEEKAVNLYERILAEIENCQDLKLEALKIDLEDILSSEKEHAHDWQEFLETSGPRLIRALRELSK